MVEPSTVAAPRGGFAARTEVNVEPELMLPSYEMRATTRAVVDGSPQGITVCWPSGLLEPYACPGPGARKQAPSVATCTAAVCPAVLERNSSAMAAAPLVRMASTLAAERAAAKRVGRWELEGV